MLIFLKDNHWFILMHEVNIMFIHSPMGVANNFKKKVKQHTLVGKKITYGKKQSVHISCKIQLLI